MIRNRICSSQVMQMSRVIKICCFLFFIAPFIGLSQSVSKTVSEVVERIAKAGSLGFDQDAQYSHFVILNDVATDEELVALTSNDSPAVRGYAFWALAKRDYTELKSIFIAHIEDKSPVFQKNGCMIGKESVISFMKQVVTPYMYDQDCMKLDDETRSLVK